MVTKYNTINLNTTQEFNWPKRVRCNECGRFVARGILNQAEHYWDNHVKVVEYKPLTEQDIRDFMKERW